MKKTLALILTLALSLAALTGCGSKTETPADTNTDNSAQTEAPATLSGSVSTNGSTSMEKVVGILSEQFMENNDGVTITYDATGSGTGIEAAANGTCDIGLASRTLKDVETEKGLAATTVALDGIAIIVNADCPMDDLTVEQIADIFTGKVTSWADFGGKGDIACIGREAGSGTRDGFESITKTAEKCLYDQELTSTGDVIATVAQNPDAIGYASLSAVKDTVKALTVGGVAPSEDTVKDGSYVVQRPFVLVTKDGEALSEAAQVFYDYALDPAQAELIGKAGAVAVN